MLNVNYTPFCLPKKKKKKIVLPFGSCTTFEANFGSFQEKSEIIDWYARQF